MEQPRSISNDKAPRTKMEEISKRFLPDKAHRFLFGPISDFYFARLLIGAAFGAITGTGLFLGLLYDFPVNTFYKVIVGYAFIALCVLGAMLSSAIRCLVLLMFPSILGSNLQNLAMLVIMHSVFQGPIANIQHNVQDVAFSIGCNMDLQIGNSKLMWRTVSEPFYQVLQEIVVDSAQFQKEAQNVSKQFQGIRNEVMGQYGYDSLGQNLTHSNSTQEEYTAKTMRRCEYVVKKGIDHCTEWFSDSWLKCMDTIKSPVISHFLCVPMKFDFLCNIMRVMTPWCKEQIPVEGNFGQTFDKLDSSINKLGEQFTANVVLEKIEDQSMFGVTVLQDDFRKELARAFKEKGKTIEEILWIAKIIFSFSILINFISAFVYVRQYTSNIFFDNVYITTYFRQIDERRKRLNKKYLLPLKKGEKSNFIDPMKIKIYPDERQSMTAKMVQVAFPALLVCVLLVTDGVLYHIFDIIRRHTFIEHSFTSSHDINIDIRGESMLANLLRKTIGAFNTSSNIDLQSSNWQCLPHPRALSISDYLSCILPLPIMIILSCVQVYLNRLHRVITAFYYPKREKKRILFLYNLQMHRHITFVNRLRKQLRCQRQAPNRVLSVLLSPLERFGWGVCWCWLCAECMRQRRAVHCSVVGCSALYCEQCWVDLNNCCICTLAENEEPQDNDSETDTVYYSH